VSFVEPGKDELVHDTGHDAVLLDEKPLCIHVTRFVPPTGAGVESG
jgi:hypothetical protein